MRASVLYKEESCGDFCDILAGQAQCAGIARALNMLVTKYNLCLMSLGGLRWLFVLASWSVNTDAY